LTKIGNDSFPTHLLKADSYGVVKQKVANRINSVIYATQSDADGASVSETKYVYGEEMYVTITRQEKALWFDRPKDDFNRDIFIQFTYALSNGSDRNVPMMAYFKVELLDTNDDVLGDARYWIDGLKFLKGSNTPEPWRYSDIILRNVDPNVERIRITSGGRVWTAPSGVLNDMQGTFEPPASQVNGAYSIQFICEVELRATNISIAELISTNSVLNARLFNGLLFTSAVPTEAQLQAQIGTWTGGGAPMGNGVFSAPFTTSGDSNNSFMIKGYSKSLTRGSITMSEIGSNDGKTFEAARVYDGVNPVKWNPDCIGLFLKFDRDNSNNMISGFFDKRIVVGSNISSLSNADIQLVSGLERTAFYITGDGDGARQQVGNSLLSGNGWAQELISGTTLRADTFQLQDVSRIFGQGVQSSANLLGVH